MNIVLPIVFMAVFLGLFVPKRYERHMFWGMAFWIIIVLTTYYLKN
ncbi:MAG: hypothetical protein V4671_29565 [Armatimonadota bacterium]